jgi:hypothetical protein
MQKKAVEKNLTVVHNSLIKPYFIWITNYAYMFKKKKLSCDKKYKSYADSTFF